MKLNLEKTTAALKLSLAKKGIATPPEAECGIVLDVSGSFDDEHKGGQTQQFVERATAWSMAFDPDKKADVFTFSRGSESAHHVGDVTPDTCDNYIAKRIINKVPGYGGGTDYSYVLELALQNFGWLQAAAPAEKKGLFGGLFGSKKAAAVTPAPKRRSIVLFVTDGANDDKDRTERVLAESEARGDQVYFLFVGVSNQPGEFRFLEKIGDRFSNTGLVVIKDLNAFARMSDEQVNDLLIGDELVAWLKK